MASTATERNTACRYASDLSFGALGGQKILAGTIVVLTAAGFARGGLTATDVVAVGVAQDTVDNTAGTDGLVNVPIRRGVWRFANSTAGDAIANADYGKPCYVVDNQTVAKTNGANTRVVAGTVRGVDDGGVWVEF